MKLRQLYSVSLQIASRRTYCSRKLFTPSLYTLNAEPLGLSRTNIGMSSGRQGNYSKVPSRGVHANTLSIKEEAGGMSAADLEKRIKHLLYLTTEAKLCIKDCDESTESDFNDEFESAKLAVDSAAIAFSELIEELASTDEGVPLLNEIRKLYAPSIESLRAELKALMK